MLDILVAKGLNFRYGSQMALDGLEVKVPDRSLFGLLGPNGSGKTTFFNIISTLLRPSSGMCRVAGTEVSENPARVRQQLGVVFQQPALDLALSVRENLRLHGALYGLKGHLIDDRIAQSLQQFGIRERAADRCKSLSGGLLRRVDLARSILHRPKLLLLDEPTNGLDPVARHAFWGFIHEMRQQYPMTVLVATHLMEEAEKCDELVILNQGKVVCRGTPEELKSTLGSDTLWISTPNPEILGTLLHEKMGWTVKQFGKALCVWHHAPDTLLTPLYRDFGGSITAVSIRKPTLEDVFLTHTGHPFDPNPSVGV
ncbi:MAG: ABC transporter ATP-binding protein [Bacteroidetes Order II. Incertae sedis bacterium]|nr:ABC transporter ATP-binding protein [Bacteroidetes Order II. bacterium]